MKANGVCAHEHPEEKELQVLDPAARPRCERADRERYEAVTFSGQALHEGGHREYQRAGEPVPASAAITERRSRPWATPFPTSRWLLICCSFSPRRTPERLRTL